MAIFFATLSCLGFALLGAGWVDKAGIPPGTVQRVTEPPPGARIAQILVFVWLVALWFGLAARPLFAATAALVTLGVFVLISRQKYAYLREPFVFSDIAFLPLLLRHPALFYVGAMQAIILGAYVIALVGIIGFWVETEPRLVGTAVQMGMLALALGSAGAFVIGAGHLAALAPELVSAVLHAPVTAFVERLGLSASLVASLMVWRREGHYAVPLKETTPTGPYQTVIIIQSESFTDLRRHGVALELPAYDRLRARALAQGRLNVSCYGAYTNRSEFEMLTGVPFEAQGMDRFHPYLRPRRFAAHSLAARLGLAGWRTVFVHPHDPQFFGRHAAIPALGFRHFVVEDDFTAADRFGPYVGDIALGWHIGGEIAAARGTSQPLFLMAVTMEAHDPYGPGRIPETDDPVEQYARHLANADAMLGHVADMLDQLTDRSLLVFYGDHAPILPGHDVLARDTATDYILLECGRAAIATTEPCSSPRSPAELNALLRARLGMGDGRGM